MKHDRISIRYAKAFIELADEMKLAAQVFEDMKMVHHLCLVKGFVRTINCPVIKQAKKIAIINALLKDRIQELSLRYLSLIVRKGRENLVHGIALQYMKMYRNKIGIKEAFFKSAAPLNDETRKAVIDTLKTQLNADIELIADVNTELIGGFIVSIDGRRYDASIRSKLDRLTREFKVNIYEKGF